MDSWRNTRYIILISTQCQSNASMNILPVKNLGETNCLEISEQPALFICHGRPGCTQTTTWLFPIPANGHKFPRANTSRVAGPSNRSAPKCGPLLGHNRSTWCRDNPCGHLFTENKLFDAVAEIRRSYFPQEGMRNTPCVVARITIKNSFGALKLKPDLPEPLYIYGMPS